MELQQVDADGKVVHTAALRVVAQLMDKQQIRTAAPIALADTAAMLRLQIFHAGAAVAVDNCWLGPDSLS
jgi:hypothetical protein